jgi:phosphonate transport system substrate-binding protein
VLRFAAIPDESWAVTQQRFTPLLRYLETRGMSGVMIATPDLASFIDAVTAKRVDFVWINGFSFVQARARMGGNLTCVAQRKEDANFRSVFVSRDSAINSIEHLAGKSIVFGPRPSVSGHLMPRFFLKQHPSEPLSKLKTIRHAVSHEATLDQVNRGVADVGVVSASALARLIAETKVDASALHVLHTTPTFVDYCFALTGDRDPTLYTALQNALTGLDPRRSDHMAILQSLRAKRVIAASDDAYAPIEEMAKEVGLLR